jgi:hypothetical protein
MVFTVNAVLNDLDDKVCILKQGLSGSVFELTLF